MTSETPMDPAFKTITEADLHAFADEQLTGQRRDLVARYLTAHPRHAAEVEAWQAQNRAFEAEFGPVAVEPVPAALSAHRIAEEIARQRWSRWGQMAAIGLVLAVGLAGGWALRAVSITGPDSPRALMQTAISAHELFVPQTIHPVEVAATESGHLTTWLSNTIDRSLVLPDLEAFGLSLIGGRILPTSAGPAAQIMYQGEDGRRMTLLLTPRKSDQPQAARFETENGVSALYLANDAITSTVVGDLPRKTMEEIVGSVLRQLRTSARPARSS